ncbi:MAG: RidA family protein [Ardenticatenaceae bacterium]|nr:RidA family protein [Ardenticatenaceae bacterium]
MSAEARVKELGIEIPAVPGAAGNYVHAVRTGNLLFLSGKGPKCSTGKVGGDVAWEDAYQDAREVGLYLVAVMREYLGSLDKVVRIVKVLGMVNAVPEFGDQPKVINGCSDLLVEIFGEKGRHARSAVGMGSLPGQITVEIELIAEVED